MKKPKKGIFEILGDILRPENNIPPHKMLMLTHDRFNETDIDDYENYINYCVEKEIKEEYKRIEQHPCYKYLSFKLIDKLNTLK